MLRNVDAHLSGYSSWHKAWEGEGCRWGRGGEKQRKIRWNNYAALKSGLVFARCCHMLYEERKGFQDWIILDSVIIPRNLKVCLWPRSLILIPWRRLGRIPDGGPSGFWELPGKFRNNFVTPRQVSFKLFPVRLVSNQPTVDTTHLLSQSHNKALQNKVEIKTKINQN